MFMRRSRVDEHEVELGKDQDYSFSASHIDVLTERERLETGRPLDES